MSGPMQVDTIHSKALPDLINKLLGERQEVLVLYHRLAEQKPYTDHSKMKPLLQHFCQVLVDYLALGHFEFYQCFNDQTLDNNCRQRIQNAIDDLYPKIAATTQVAVAFNDCYQGEEPCRDLSHFGHELSRLGEQLAERIELEDRLIDAIRTTQTASAA